jgi:ribosomal-protein-alanine N-acetyltransferase
LIDLEQYCAMEMDADVRRYVGGYPRSRDDAERKFRNGPLRKTSDRLGVWATVLKPDGPYIGRSGLYPHVQSGGRITVGEAAPSFYIAREFWGQGFATEAAVALVKFGLEELKLSRIVQPIGPAEACGYPTLTSINQAIGRASAFDSQRS